MYNLLILIWWLRLLRRASKIRHVTLSLYRYLADFIVVMCLPGAGVFSIFHVVNGSVFTFNILVVETKRYLKHLPWTTRRLLPLANHENQWNFKHNQAMKIRRFFSKTDWLFHCELYGMRKDIVKLIALSISRRLSRVQMTRTFLILTRVLHILCVVTILIRAVYSSRSFIFRNNFVLFKARVEQQ